MLTKSQKTSICELNFLYFSQEVDEEACLLHRRGELLYKPFFNFQCFNCVTHSCRALICGLRISAQSTQNVSTRNVSTRNRVFIMGGLGVGVLGT